MSEVPERIWLNLGNEEITYSEAMMGDVTWCEHQQDEWDIEYVRADLYAHGQRANERARQRIQALERQQIPPELWEEIEGWRSQSARGLRMTAQQQAFLLARIASYRPEASLGEKDE